MAALPGRRPGAGRLGRLWGAAQGLRPPGGQARGRARSAAGSATCTSGWPSGSTACPAVAGRAAAAGGGAGPLPPAPRAAGPPAGPGGARPRSRPRRAGRRGAVLRRGRRLLGAAAGAGRADPRPQAGRHRAGRRAGRRLAPTRAAPCTWPPPASTPATRSSWWPRPCRRRPRRPRQERPPGGAVADLDELRARLEGIAEELADAAMDALRQAAGGRRSAPSRGRAAHHPGPPGRRPCGGGPGRHPAGSPRAGEPLTYPERITDGGRSTSTRGSRLIFRTDLVRDANRH